MTGAVREQLAFDAPFAISVVDANTLRGAGPQVNLSEALGRVPGLVVNLRNNYAQDLQISSRGFGARASFGVRGVRLVADGIPAAGPDGQGQVSHFDIAGAERVEVLRGPFSALYGASSGGVISLISRVPKERRVILDADAGSAGLRQGRVTVEAPLDGGFSLRATASAFEVQGTRPHSQARRALGNMRLGWDGANDQVVLTANSLDQPAQDPLGLTRAQIDADPGQTTPVATQFSARKTLWQSQAGGTWVHRFDDASALQRSSLALYAGKRGVTQWQAIAVATQTPTRHPGGVINFDRAYNGADARLFWRGEGWRLVTGLALDAQREDRRGFENFSGTGTAQVLGVTGKLRRDEDNRADTRDLYAQGEVDLTQSLILSAGLRRGRLNISSTDKFLSNGDDSGALAFGYSLPVLALRWQPLSPLNLYVSAGKGQESPTLGELAYRPDGLAGFNTALRAQRSQQFELGVKWRLEAALNLEAAVFNASTDDEIGVQNNSGGRATFQNVGRTKRRGAELSLRWSPAPAWRTALSATVLSATYRDDFLTCPGTPCTVPTARVAAGLRIAGTVPRSLFTEVVWSPGAFEFATEVRGQGRQSVNDLNSDFAGGYGLVALRALAKVALGPGRLEALARIDNLGNRRVQGSVIVNEGNARFFEPAAGRNALLSLRWVLGF